MVLGRTAKDRFRIEDIQWGDENPYQKIADAFAMSEDFGQLVPTEKIDGRYVQEDLGPLFFATLRFKMHEAVHEEFVMDFHEASRGCGVPWFNPSDADGDFTESYSKDAEHFSGRELRRVNQLASGIVDYVEQKVVNLKEMRMMDVFRELDRQIMWLGSYISRKNHVADEWDDEW